MKIVLFFCVPVGYVREMPKRAKSTDLKAGARNNITFDLTPTARAIVHAEVERTGMPKTILAERVFTWFAAQSDVVRGVILGTVPESVSPDVARIILERMAKPGK